MGPGGFNAQGLYCRSWGPAGLGVTFLVGILVEYSGSVAGPGATCCYSHGDRQGTRLTGAASRLCQTVN